MWKVFKNLSIYKWLLVSVIGLVFLQAMSELFLPTLMGDIVDNGVVKGNVPYIWKTGGIMLIVAAIGVVAAITASFYASKVAMALGRDIRRKLFTHVESFACRKSTRLNSSQVSISYAV